MVGVAFICSGTWHWKIYFSNCEGLLLKEVMILRRESDKSEM